MRSRERICDHGCIYIDGLLPISFIPLLVVVLLVELVGGVDSKVLLHPSRQFELLVDFVEQEIVLLAHHTMTVRTVLGEHLEAYIV